MSDAELQKRLTAKSKRAHAKRSVKNFDVVLENNKVLIPRILRQRIIAWHHYWLTHPDHERMFKTINQTLTWPRLHRDCTNYCKTYHKCQSCKKKLRKHGKLPPKEAETVPWYSVRIDCVGTHTAKQKASCKIGKKKSAKIAEKN